MEYDILSFTNKLRDLMYLYFPYEGQVLKEKKHKKTPKHIRDVAFMENSLEFGGDNMISFQIGNEESERDYPYYHILEDAPVIRKRDKGTAKTKGSQMYVKDKAKRDYNKVEWNGKTFTKEYSRNVRGSRSRNANTTRYVYDYMGNKVKLHPSSNSYQNVHYHYIEKMMNNFILDDLASTFNLKRGRTQDTGLIEDFAVQEGLSIEQVLDIFGSFME